MFHFNSLYLQSQLMGTLYFQDHSNNRFYTVIGYWFNEIDIQTGKTIPKIKIDVDIYSKVSLWHSHLYILKRQQTSTGKIRSYVERVDF